MNSTVQLPLLRNDFPIQNYAGKGWIYVLCCLFFSLNILFIVFFVNFHFDPSPKKMLLSVFTGFIINMIAYHLLLRILPDWVKQKDIIGNIQFALEEIIVCNEGKTERINLNSLRQIDLHSDGFRGKRLGRYYRCNGINEIKFTDNSGTVFNYRYFIKTKDEFEQLANIMGFWYKKHFPIHERAHNNNVICFLMVAGNSYSEMQRLKKQYEIS